MKRQELKVVFLGGAQAGCIGLLTLLADGCTVLGVVAYDDIMKRLAVMLQIPTFLSVNHPKVEAILPKSDLLVCVHGREIVQNELLALPRFGGINVHPCLYAYKGANPIGRLLKDGNTKASVGVHCMTDKVDQGATLIEEFVDVSGKTSVEEIYNALYPFYTVTLLRTIHMISLLGATYLEGVKQLPPSIFLAEEDIFPWDEDLVSQVVGK